MSRLLAGEGFGKTVIGKQGIDKAGVSQEKEAPPTLLARTGETLRDGVARPIEGMQPGLTEILGKIKSALESDPAFQRAIEQHFNTIGIFLPVQHFDETCFEQKPQKGLRSLGALFTGKPKFDLVPCESKKGGWKHGDFVFSFSFMGRSEAEPEAGLQRLWAAVVIAEADVNKVTNQLHAHPEDFFNAILQGAVIQGILRAGDGQRIVIEPGENAILLANKQYGGGWDSSYPSANPFPKGFKPNS